MFINKEQLIIEIKILNIKKRKNHHLDVKKLYIFNLVITFNFQFLSTQYIKINITGFCN